LNNLGFRGPDPVKDNDEAEFRILCLGDSRTFGFGINNYSDTLTGKLQELVEEQGLSNSHFRVFNLGVLGYTSFQGKKLLETVGFTLDPDLVICWFGYNDSMFFHITDEEAGHRGNFVLKANALINELYTYQLLQKTIKPILRSSSAPIQVDQRIVRRVSPEEYKKNLLHIVKECKKHRVPVVLMNSPIRPEIPMVMNPKLIRYSDESGCQFEKLQLQYDLEGFWMMEATEFPGNEKSLDLLLEKYPDLPILHYYKSLILEKRGDFQNAEAESKLASDLDTERTVMGEYNQATGEIAGNQGVELIDLISAFDGVEEGTLFLDESHPNLTGHTLIASEILDILIKSR